MLFTACTTDAFEEVSIVRPQTITVSLEDNSRIQLSEGKSIWTEGDLVTVFYRSNYPQKWQFQGQTGDTTGTLLCVDDNLPEMEPNRDDIVTVYPHNDNISLEDVSMMLELPAEQTYLKDSFGTDGTLMVSVSKDNNAKLSSVLGWVKLQLTGSGETVSSVSFKGNSHEQIAGLVTINISDLSSTMRFSSLSVEERENLPDTFKSVTLNCPEGVVLSDKATTFYIALPPQTFSNGFTVTILCEDGSKMTKSTEKSVTIKRNTILPMDSVETDFESVPNNQIWYTTEKGRALSGLNFEYQSNTYENGLGIITFENDVTAIADEAFANSDVTAVYLPKCVQTIGKSAFSYCEKLEKVNLPDALTLISESAFENCLSITKVIIPNGVTEIGDNAFYGCESITKFSLEQPVNSRAQYTVSQLKKIGNGAFCGCSKISRVCIPGSVIIIGDKAFSECITISSVAISNSVTTLGEGAFSYCSSLKEVSLEETTVNSHTNSQLQTIGSYAFYGCPYIITIHIPESVVNFGDEVFACCPGLTYFSGKFASDDRKCLVVGDKLKAFAGEGIKDYSIPTGVTEIGAGVFEENTELENLTLPYSIKNIGDYAFASSNIRNIALSGVVNIGVAAFADTKIQEIVIPRTVESIGIAAFMDCVNLKKVVFVPICKLTCLPESCFDSCYSLEEITIPDSITHLGECVLCDCYNMKKVYFESQNPPIIMTDGEEECFLGEHHENRKIYVPRKSVEKYRSAFCWRQYASDIEPYDVIE